MSTYFTILLLLNATLAGSFISDGKYGMAGFSAGTAILCLVWLVQS